MKHPGDITASVLPVVLVVSVVVMLLMLGLLSLWEINFLYITRHDYIRKQRSNIESFFTLYCTHPEVGGSLDADSTYLLYENDPASRMKVSISPWGLYESVCVSSMCGKVFVCRLLGADGNGGDGYALWYRNGGMALTITGKSEIIGNSALPANGLIYGQMQSVFFSGSEILPSTINSSENEMPSPDEGTVDVIEDIFSYITSSAAGEFTGTAENDFMLGKILHISIVDGELYDCSYTGNIILTGERILVDSTCRLRNVILAANYIEITDGVKGVFQAFAKDSINIRDGVLLDFPSGLYSENKINIGEKSIVNGYVVNNFGGEKDLTVPNTVKDKTSRIRGFYYGMGISQIQGIITGISYIDEAVFYSSRGYYRNLFYDASFLPGDGMANPLWLDRKAKRKVAGWDN